MSFTYQSMPRFPITKGPWKAVRSHEEFAGPYFDIDPEERAEYDARPFTGIESAAGQKVVTAHDLFEFKKADALAIAKVPELLETALWAEAALGFLATKASTEEDRAEFRRRFEAVSQLLNEIRS